MASCDLGYRDERFENDVDENFHCPICMNVLKDPVMCQRGNIKPSSKSFDKLSVEPQDSL